MKIPPPSAHDVGASLPHLGNVAYVASGGWKDVFSFQFEGKKWALLLVPLYKATEIVDPDDFERVSHEIRSRVRREVRILSESNTTGLVKIGPLLGGEDGLGTAEINGRQYLWFTEEFVEGESLKKLIAGAKLANTADMIDLLEQLLPSLEYFRNRKVVHRDIKPENIMRAEGKHRAVFTLLDAGIVLDEQGTRWTVVGNPMGTWRYMSPEQLRGDTLDWRSDLFALGVAAFEYATGFHPFAKGTTNITTVLTNVLNEAPQGLASARPDMPAKLHALVGRMLSKKPHLRPGSISLILDELRQIRGETGL